MKALDFTTPHVLRNDEEFGAAKCEIDRLLLLNPEPYSEDYEALDFYTLLVEAYESEKHPHHPVPAREIVEFMIEQKGISRGDIAARMGGRSRLSDYLSGKRELSKSQALALGEMLHISLDRLLQSSVGPAN